MVKRETDDYCDIGDRYGYQGEISWCVIVKVVQMVVIITDDRECTNGTTGFRGVRRAGISSMRRAIAPALLHFQFPKLWIQLIGLVLSFLNPVLILIVIFE